MTITPSIMVEPSVMYVIGRCMTYVVTPTCEVMRPGQKYFCSGLLFMCEWSINILLMDILFITNSLNEKISLILYKNNKRVNYENIPQLRT